MRGKRKRLTGVPSRGRRDFGAAEVHGFEIRSRVVTGIGGVSSARAKGEIAMYGLGGEPPAGAKGPTL